MRTFQDIFLIWANAHFSIFSAVHVTFLANNMVSIQNRHISENLQPISKHKLHIQWLYVCGDTRDENLSLNTKIFLQISATVIALDCFGECFYNANFIILSCETIKFLQKSIIVMFA